MKNAPNQPTDTSHKPINPQTKEHTMTGTETPTDLVVFPNGANIFPNITENIHQLTQDNHDGRYDDLIDFLRDLTDEDYLATPRGLVFTTLGTLATNGEYSIHTNVEYNQNKPGDGITGEIRTTPANQPLGPAQRGPIPPMAIYHTACCLTSFLYKICGPHSCRVQ